MNNEANLQELRKLIKEVMFSVSKRDALKAAFNFAKQASGSVKDKEHWISCAESSFRNFESRVKTITKK